MTGASASTTVVPAESEVLLLSVMMLSTEARVKAAKHGVTVDQFHDPRHRVIARAVLDLNSQFDWLDPGVVVDHVRERGLLDDAGGRDYVFRVGGEVASVGLTATYIEKVQNAARRRDVVTLAARLSSAAMDGKALEPIMSGLVAATSTPTSDITCHPGSIWLDTPSLDDARLWGVGDRVAWASGEPLLIVGPTGVGKTTIAGQLVKARMGLASTVLGFPVVPGERVLYCALDRPQQIARAMTRRGVLGDVDRLLMDERLVVCDRLPSLVVDDPLVLLRLAHDHHADTIVVDSVKDIAPGLNSDEHGMAIHAALNAAARSGVEVIALHHHRKGDGDQPKTVDAVYGSTFITAGAGSVLSLWADRDGVAVQHLKHVGADFGVHRIVHDQFEGTSTATHFDPDPVSIVVEQGCITAYEFAQWRSGDDEPSDWKQRQARDLLSREVDAGRLRLVAGRRTQRGSEPDTFCLPVEAR